MDLNRVATFVKVVETGSFTQAANALGLPKSSVSRSVSELEKSLGVLLLQRTTRQLHLTDAGKRYFETARVALGELAQAESELSGLGSEPRGTVSVTVPPDLGDNTFASIVTDFSHAYPQVQIQVLVSSRRVDLVQEGVDIAVRAGELQDSSLIAQKVGTSDLALYASRSYLDRKGEPRALADLADHDCVLYRERRSRWTLTGPDGSESVVVHGSISADDLVFLQGAVAAGAGIGLLPVFRACQTVQRVLPNHALRGSPIHVVTPSIRHQTAAVSLFREHLVKRLSSLSFSDRCLGGD